MKVPNGVTRIAPDAALFTRVARFNADVGGADLADALQGCAGWLVEVDGGSVALALRNIGPDVVEITAAEGRGAGSVLDYLPWLESQLAPRRVRFVTMRRGLLRELAKHGYGVRAVIVEKETGHGRPIQ